MNLTIRCPESQEDFLVESLKKQQIEDFEFGDHGESLLIFENDNPSLYDFSYLIDTAINYQWTETRILIPKNNTGNSLILLNDDYSINSPKVLDDDYLDGYQEVGIQFLFSKGNKEGPFGLPMVEQKDQDFFPKKRPCLFLDRDGIINKEGDYPHRIGDIEFQEEIFPIIQWAKEKQFWVIVLTNQAGIARGFFDSSAVIELHQLMQKEMEKKNCGANAWYFCPHYFPKGIGEWKKKALARKPEPGLLLKALEEFPIDLNSSFMIGDKVSDALKMPGLQSFILEGNYDLTGASASTFSSLSEIHSQIKYLSQN